LILRSRDDEEEKGGKGRTLDDVLGLHRTRDGRADVLGELHEQGVDLVERPRRLLAELDGGDVLGDAVQCRELERLLCRANLGAVVLDVRGELRAGGEAGQRGGVRVSATKGTHLQNGAGDRAAVEGERLEPLRVVDAERRRG